MTKIVKSTITLTVLHPADETAVFKNASLESILEEVDGGGWIAGTAKKSEPIEIPADKLHDELQAIGNDGTFFDDGAYDPLGADDDEGNDQGPKI